MPDPFVILMAEDDEHDVVATRRAWKTHGIANPLHVVGDGEECLDYLFHRGAYAEPCHAPRPGVLLLDINMPRLDGLATLEHIRRTEEFQHLPVVMLSSSRAEEDRIKSYDLGANAYIVKPVGFDNFSEAIRTIQLFWQLTEPSGGGP